MTTKKTSTPTKKADTTSKKANTTKKEEKTMKTQEKKVAEAKTQTTEKAEKKSRKSKMSSEAIIASIPKNDRLTFEVNAKGAVHVKCGKYRIFGHSGPIIVVTREDFLPNSIPKDARNYGFRVDPTEANMKTIINHALSVIDKKAEEKAKAEAERKAKAEKAKTEKAKAEKKTKKPAAKTKKAAAEKVTK